MKKNLTELVFILDRSGSMGGLEQDTIGGFNAMLTRQKEQEGEANVTTILFDHEVQLLHDRFPLKAVAPLTEKDYYVRGCTAMLDAIGYGMEKMVNIQCHLPEDERAEKVIFVITTDGLENAMEKAGQKLVLEKAARDAAGAAALPLSRRLRKLEQLLAKLDEEEQRLLGMCAAREDGLLLQAWLWRWPADFRAPELVLPPPDEGDGDTPRKTVKLDMRRSVRDNMERLFHTARRGQRGLEHLAERRAVLRAELATVQAARQEALLGGIGHAAGEAGKPDRNTVALGALRGAALPRNVQLFVSDDGFALLRGRDAKGNIAARKLAAAHDIWLHTDGGPGSHVIIRRAHAGQEVPERTLDQAGALAACKSWQKDAARARILYAEVRHIRSMRGAGTGTVRMDKILYSREVPVDASLETRLLPESPAGKTDGTGRD